MVAGQAQALAQTRDEEGPAGEEGACVLPLPAEGGQGAFGGSVPVGGGPAVLGVVIGPAQRGADGAVQVVGPDRVRILGDHRPFDEPACRGLVGQACRLGGQVQVEGVQEAGAAQDMALVGGEVGQGAGDEGGEGVVEVVGGGSAAGAADLEEACDGQVQVERQAVRALGDDRADVGADQRLAVLGEAACEVGVAVLGGEVADQVLAIAAGGLGRLFCLGCEAGPGVGAGEVQLSLQSGVGPRQAVAGRR
ncbi:hypothetical protein [Streptomyces sp. MK37H]|uniref:hypothetical protein n=1 Tax=Streptomyces sp. MK37H TaxID=2699117 RepID=UPI001B359DAF|nr:hypothetical protein [Streptomyces sp. MK37H]MBP8534071.1 hypothetical protein [Streptomyces sp. MK37H]